MDIQKVENVNHVISIDQKTIPEPKTNVKKRKSSNNFFKVALFMMRGHSRKSKMLPVDNESRSIWRRLVGSMRPMHLQSNQSSPPQKIDKGDNQKMVISIENASNENDNIQSEDGFDSASEFPSPASSRYASAVGLSEMVNLSSQVSSRYASAVGLSEMVEEEKESEKEKENEEGEGDEMIDAKADEFIAQFYKQMKLQRMDIVDRHYKEMSMRSLGL